MATEQASGAQRMGEGDGDRRESMARDEPMLSQGRAAQPTPKSRTCSHCGELGHYRTTCPMLSSSGASDWYSPGVGSSLRGCTECGRIGGHKKSCSLAVYESANRMSYPSPQESPYREPEKRPSNVWKPVEPPPPRMDVAEGGGKPRYCGACGSHPSNRLKTHPRRSVRC